MKRALVLGGGGTLGAYQMGAWKALRELGLSFDIVTGTSIGALNGAFVVMDKYDLAIQLWNTITATKVMKNGISVGASEIKTVFKKDPSRIQLFLQSYLKNKGADISPFISLVKEYVDPVAVKNSPTIFGVNVVSWPYLSEKRIVINQVPEANVLDYLHASSALWPIFPAYRIGNRKYIDGGYRDDITVDFAFKLGAQSVLAINLWYKKNVHPRLISKPSVTLVTPSWDLGSPLMFSHKVIDRNMILGYNDAMKALHRKLGFRFTFSTMDYRPELSELFIALVRCDFPDFAREIERLLERHTGGIANPNDYYLRAIEIMAETLEIDHLKIYTAHELLNICYDNLCADFDPAAVVGLLRKIKKNKPFSRAEERKALCAMKYMIVNKKNLDEINKMTKWKPKIAMLYILLFVTAEERNRNEQ